MNILAPSICGMEEYFNLMNSAYQSLIDIKSRGHIPRSFAYGYQL